MAVEYTKFECVRCGKDTSNYYSEPYYTKLLAKKLCFLCNHQDETDEKVACEHTKMTIIGGHIYSPGNRTEGSFRGMAGRRFDIEYIEPSIYAGQKTTTFDLWSGANVSPAKREQFSDTAKFLGDAEMVTFTPGSLYEACWNPSSGKYDPFPLPHMLKPNPKKD